MIQDQLLDGTKSIVVWGGGFIGGTTAMAYASEGVRVVIFDVNDLAVEQLNRGYLPVTNLEFWFGASMKDFVDRGLVQATSKLSDIADLVEADSVAAHMIAVPTEKDGEPYLGIVQKVLDDLVSMGVRNSTALVVIESTLVPRTAVRLTQENGLEGQLCIATRRDWFHSPDQNLKNLPRVYCAYERTNNERFRQILSVICDSLIEASEITIAEMVKSVENSLLHIPCVYLNQLSQAYPDIDISEVASLAATHWRIPRYYPSFKTGGYCIPVSSKYVLLGATHPEALTIPFETVKFDQESSIQPVLKLIRARSGPGNVLLLGLSYKGDLKVAQLSPSLKVLEAFPDMYVQDPYYTVDEIKSIAPESKPLGPGSTEFGDLMIGVVVIVSDHKAYKRIPRQDIVNWGCHTIIDNYAIWKKHRVYFKENGIEYHCPGDGTWG